MSSLRRIVLACAVVLALPVVAPGVAAAAEPDIVDVPVSFQVANQNHTPIACVPAQDDRTYTVHGRLIAPRAALQSPSRAVTLYLHGLGYSSFFFHFTDVPGYDYATQQAAAGHASVIIDRLGNPAHDDLPNGNATCLPAQADMADQIVRALRAGRYTADGGATSFGRVVLAGHSAGGFIAQITQYWFRSADALAVISYNDVPSTYALTTFFNASTDCLLAPRRARGTTGAPNYAAFGRTDADFAAGHFFDVDPAVAAAVLRRRNLDPCGDLMSALGALLADQALTALINVPVLVISGDKDALFTPPTDQLQALRSYPLSPDVQLVRLPGTGHAVTLGRTHEAFRAAMDRWLTAHGA